MTVQEVIDRLEHCEDKTKDIKILNDNTDEKYEIEVVCTTYDPIIYLNLL